ncbi:hypothetical protein EVJ50_11795 [Synechococcus sp. RSCCF101]|uniref:hypothetical protein n=1 Tax=Synechococcus sp. RSCCF101 TaxID=2511069 RepID=UPI001245834F|nr:hypothetical protein [Synechococcus sp. RSCCF101]QEY32812.1 hypothetical protein EVJ50_11795 [Synechococcus sp. RSCCF101]
MGLIDRIERSWIRPRRGPALTLGRRNLFILPSRFGWLWLLTCVVLYLLGINGGSSGPLLLAYLGVGVFLLVMPLTQFTLQGVRLESGRPEPGFADQTLLYPLEIHSPESRGPVRIRLTPPPGRAPAEPSDTPLDQDLMLPAGRLALALPWNPSRRGWQRPGRLRIATTAPLGLFYCWGVWEPDAAQLVYPARRHGPVRELGREGATQSGMAGREMSSGSEEFTDLAPHRLEEGLSRLAWKQLARSGERFSKQFGDPLPPAPLLAPASELSLENGLKALSDRIWTLSHGEGAYGLQLGGSHLAPSRGRDHRDRCLRALALWDGGR